MGKERKAKEPSILIKIIITIFEGKEEKEIHPKELIIELQSKEREEETILDKIQKILFKITTKILK